MVAFAEPRRRRSCHTYALSPRNHAIERFFFRNESFHWVGAAAGHVSAS